MSVYEGRVVWVGADNFSKDGGVRAKISTYDEFFNVPGRFAQIFQKGAEIKVALALKGKKYFAENAKLVSGASEAPPPRSAGGSSSGGSGGGGVDWAAKDKAIQYQSSRKDALQLVELLIANGALPLGSGKADKKAEIILGEIDRYTGRFFRDIGTLGAVKRDAAQREEDPEVEEDDDDVSAPDAAGDDDWDDDVPF